MKLKNVAELYRQSPEWRKLAVNSRIAYEGGLLTLKDFLEKDAKKITRPMVMDLKDSLYDQRGKCRMAMAVLSNIMQYGYDRGLCDYNHAVRIGSLPPKVPWKRWDMKDVLKLMKVAPRHIRHAVMLALYTGQRRSDLTKMQWSNYDGTHIHIVQKKTKKALAIPVHPALKEELDLLQEERGISPYILTNIYGDGWADNSLTAAITRWAKAAGCEGNVLHGLRKTTASCLAELGCTPHQIAAITGQSLEEVMHYTREADQKKMADEAVAIWSR